APALLCADEDALAKEARVGVTVWHGELRHWWTHPPELEVSTFGGNALARLDALLPALPSPRHLLGRQETPLAVRVEETALGRGLEGHVVAERGERVVDEPAVVVDVARVVRDDPRDPATLGEVHERAGERSLRASRVVELHLDGEALV